MKKNLSKLAALTMILSLSACGGKDAAPKQTAKADAPAPTPEVTEPAYQNITLSQYLSGGESIWFRVENLASAPFTAAPA